MVLIRLSLQSPAKLMTGLRSGLLPGRPHLRNDVSQLPFQIGSKYENQLISHVGGDLSMLSQEHKQELCVHLASMSTEPPPMLRLCCVYIICHTYVGHNPERDEQMALTYHNVGHVAMIDHAIGEEILDSTHWHWARALCWGVVLIVTCARSASPPHELPFPPLLCYAVSGTQKGPLLWSLGNTKGP